MANQEITSKGRQTFLGIGDFGEAGVGVFPESEKFLMICGCLEIYFSRPTFLRRAVKRGSECRGSS